MQSESHSPAHKGQRERGGITEPAGSVHVQRPRGRIRYEPSTPVILANRCLVVVVFYFILPVLFNDLIILTQSYCQFMSIGIVDYIYICVQHFGQSCFKEAVC